MFWLKTKTSVQSRLAGALSIGLDLVKNVPDPNLGKTILLFSMCQYGVISGTDKGFGRLIPRLPLLTHPTLITMSLTILHIKLSGFG
jgi:hypothetical protein